MRDITKRRGYAIGEVSRLTGVNIETIRYYERIAILLPPDRTAGGNRQYNHDQIKRLSFVKKCRDLGFSLDEIRTLLQMVDRKDYTCGQVHNLTTTHLATVNKKLADLSRLKNALTSMAAQCDKGDMPQCAIIDTLYA